MPFANTTRSYTDTRKRTATQYVKFSTDHRVVLRILDENAKFVYKHWIAEANKGRGLGAICPGLSVCPIDLAIKDLPRENEERIEKVARKRYITNVLDRTPYTVCSSCNEKTPGKVCQNCGADISKKHEFFPLNQVKILEGGPRLFLETLNFIEASQQEDLDLPITGYDIIFTSAGKNRDRKISALPVTPPTELTEADFVDPTTGQPQQLFDLDLLSEPSTPEEIALMAEGKTMQEINQALGID